MLTTLFLAVLLQTPIQGNFHVYFTHDGANTDHYEVSVDGVRSQISTTCTGSGETRECSAPITLTLNIKHTVSVVAVGLFGEAGSLPFTCDVPKASVNVRVAK